MTAAMERRMMLGTEHKLDYLILKERDGTGLAIKPVYAANSRYGLCIVLKVRVARMPSAPSGFKDWKNLWPEMQWSANDSLRASTTIVRFTGCTTHQLGEAIEHFGDYANSLIDYLDKVFEGLDHDKADAVAFIASVVLSVWQAAWDAMQKSSTNSIDLAKVYTHGESPGHVHGLSVESVGEGVKAASEAAYAKFQVIEGGKTKVTKADFSASDDDEGDDFEDAEDENDDPDDE